MLRSSSKQSGGIHVVKLKKEKERLRWERICKKERY